MSVQAPIDDTSLEAEDELYQDLSGILRSLCPTDIVVVADAFNAQVGYFCGNKGTSETHSFSKPIEPTAATASLKTTPITDCFSPR